MPRALRTASSAVSDVAELVPRDEPAAKGLLRGLPQQLGREPASGAVVQRAAGARRRYRAEPGAVLGCHVGVVEHDAGWHAEAPPSPGLGQREVDLRRQHVGEPVQRQRGLVRDHPGLLGPEPGGDQLLVLARREVDEPVDPAAHAGDAAAAGCASASSWGE